MNEPCVSSTTGEVSNASENEFCTTPLFLDDSGIPLLESLNSVLCDPSYQSWVICDLSAFRSLDPNERTYFPDASLSTIFFQRADNCPIPSLNLGIDCFDETIAYNEFYAGESVGPTSRCLNAYTDTTNLGRAYRPACIRVTCDLTERVVRIGQNETEQICEYDGQLLVVPGARADNATLICPRLASVCPILFTCPDGCFGRGDCIYNADSNGRTVPTCRCFDTNNTHPSCAPSSIINRFSNSTTSQPIASPIALPSFFSPNTSTTFNPVATSSPPTASPNPPPTHAVPPPTEVTPSRVPSPMIRVTNVPATNQPTSSSICIVPFSTFHSMSFVTTTITSTVMMLLGTGLWI